MVVRFWEHTNQSGNVIDIWLYPNLDGTIASAWDNDLHNNKMPPSCRFFCKRWANRISSVSWWWYAIDVWHAPTFSGTRNVDVLIPQPFIPDAVSLRKVSTASSWWNAGASSPVRMGSMNEHQINSTTTNYMLGLSHTTDNDVN